MRVLLFTLIPLVAAFAPNLNGDRTQTKLAVNRRDALLTGASFAGMFGLPLASIAFQQPFQKKHDDQLTETPQLRTGGKVDLNSAYVADYMEMKGMFPSAAGKIASNGPYKAVKDIYKIDDLTDKDVQLFKKYEKLFTVNPPGRQSKERINARVST